MRISIALPAWGYEYVQRFLGHVLDSHVDALANYDGDVRYLLYSDDPDRVGAEIARRTGRPIEQRPLKRFNSHYSMLLRCHADALAHARGDIVVLTNADILLSAEAFAAIQARIGAGFKVVMCCGTRTDPKEAPPRPASGPALCEWAVKNMHQITKDLIWGEGCTTTPSFMYFRSGDSVVMRAFHLHPIGVLADREFQVEKSIDWNLGNNVGRDEIHVVTDPAEMAMAEISAPSKEFARLAQRYRMRDVLAWSVKATNDLHWWLLQHSIRLTGTVDCGDAGMILELMRRRDGNR